LIDSITNHDYETLPQECAICMETMQMGTPEHPVCLGCGHMFCAKCLSSQLNGINGWSAACAVCRKQYSKEDMYAIKPTVDANSAQAKASCPPSDAEPGGDDAKGWADLYSSLRARPSSKQRKVLERFHEVRRKEPEAKFLFFCGFDPIQKELQASLEEAKVECRAIGGLAVNARAKALHEFESDPDVSVLLVPIGVGAVGLNLTMANHVFIVDPPNNLTLLKQAIGRCWRMGQGRPVHVHKFVAKDTIDIAMLEAAKKFDAGEADAEEEEESPMTKTKTQVNRGATIAAPMQNDRGTGIALLARKELLSAFGFTEDQVYNRERDYDPRRHGRRHGR